jgi:hypothetical protein
LQKNQPLLFGLATDDSHNYHQYGSAYSNAGRGWVMVLADSLTPKSLISAMERGAFYSSTGVLLKDINFEDNKLHLTVQAEPNVTYTIAFIGVTKEEQQSHLLKEVTGTEAHFELTKDHLFVRVKVTSDKVKTNPFQEGEHEMAWTQPVQYRN